MSARSIGLIRLSTLLEIAFRDDIRNGMFHGDYVLWSDGLRLRRRNGGHAIKLSFEQINEALAYGVGFFQLLAELNQVSVASFDPPRTINGRFSSNPPMPWTVAYDKERGSFGISSSSPGPIKDAAYERQETINSLLGGRVLSTYGADAHDDDDLAKHIAGRGFEPHEVLMEPQAFQALSARINAENLWDSRLPRHQSDGLLMLSPWGFSWIRTPQDFDALLPAPILAVRSGEANGVTPGMDALPQARG